MNTAEPSWMQRLAWKERFYRAELCLQQDKTTEGKRLAQDAHTVVLFCAAQPQREAGSARGKCAQWLLQPRRPAGSAAPGLWSPLPSFWVHRASCQGGLQRRKLITGPVLFFNPRFFQAQSRDSVFRLLLKTLG